MIIIKTLNNTNCRVTNNDTFIYPKDTELTGEDLLTFIGYNSSDLHAKYRRNMRLYLGKHPILNELDKPTGADNKLVVNMPKYLVDTYNGFFSGLAPKITLADDNLNNELQDWNNSESFFDKLNEISKQSDIYGRSIAFIYQGEDSEPHIAFSSPTHAFIIYDDTVAREPLAFVRYQIPTGSTYTQATGHIQYADKLYTFESSSILPDTETNSSAVNPYGIVPAVEFFENEERQGVFDGVVSLIEELDKATSQKANQVEYFDNAYLTMMGIRLPEDDKGRPKIDIKNNRFLYLPNVDPNAPQPKVEFLAKPDADTIQENLIDRITSQIFQMSMVTNLNDQEFSGNSSGVALDFKLLPMRNKASNKERKFTKALRQLYKIVFTVLFDKSNIDSWQDLQFQFSRNLPANISDEVNNAKNVEGIVSKETQLSLLSFVSDPKLEIDNMNKEKAEAVKQAQENMQAMPDLLKARQDNSDNQAQDNQNNNDNNPNNVGTQDDSTKQQ